MSDQSVTGNKCSKQVYDGTFKGHSCRLKAVVQRNNKWYCAVHDPVAVERKRQERLAKWNTANKLQQRRYKIENRNSKLLQALEACAEWEIAELVHAWRSDISLLKGNK